MQLDCFELKQKLLLLNKASGRFTTIVNKMFRKCENLVKVVSSDFDTIEEAYWTLIKHPNNTDFGKIINIVGFKNHIKYKKKKSFHL